mmetsp:Transcript_28867/g.62860  ORF Transcript_28867/g.62860 Transcript_28867/m.62860 type:complete len:340 (+) Transcript_28867:53-1072(+)
MAVTASSYYKTYYGHEVEHLDVAYDALRRRHESIIFLAGDSSLDNKYWLGQRKAALNGYEDFLRPPEMKADVCYWLNYEAVRRGADLGCINTAVEATSLSDRACCWLLQQDRFIRRHITSKDHLIVSVGGNDIALKPVLCTILNMLVMSNCVPKACIEHWSCGCPPLIPPNTGVDCGCFLCGLPGCITGLLACPPSFGYFIDLFGNIVQNYVLRLIGCTRPQKVVVCTIYFPDEMVTGSWADAALGALGYNSAPDKLQAAIRTIFRLATARICIPGTEVVAFPLFEVLDGKTTSDYVARVEPSVSGGAKMASALMDAILEEEVGQNDPALAAPGQMAME